MSEESGTQEPQEQQPQEGEAQTFTADYVAKLRQESAKYRTEAKANAEAAAKLAEIEDAQKSDAQRAADRIAELESAAAAAQADALRFKIATKHGITDEDAELFLTGSDEATLTRQAERLAARVAKSDPPPVGVYVPNSGHQPSPPALNSNDLEEALRRKLGLS